MNVTGYGFDLLLKLVKDMHGSTVLKKLSIVEKALEKNTEE